VPGQRSTFLYPLSPPDINRRHMTTGQRAMALAMIYPEPEKAHKGKKSEAAKVAGFGQLSRARIKEAPRSAFLSALLKSSSSSVRTIFLPGGFRFGSSRKSAPYFASAIKRCSVSSCATLLTTLQRPQNCPKSDSYRGSDALKEADPCDRHRLMTPADRCGK
ncbi:MAG: hypothetical protein ACREX9_14900, partial [Gammaproteobacteria bacterium]